jgi:hypothetical protein
MCRKRFETFMGNVSLHLDVSCPTLLPPSPPHITAAPPTATTIIRL